MGIPSDSVRLLLLKIHTLRMPVPSRRQKKGFLLLEALLGSMIFIVLIVALLSIFFHGRDSTTISGDRVRGVVLASQALEGVGAVRNQGYSMISDPLIADGNPHGIAVNPQTYLWAFTGASMQEGKYTISVKIVSLGDTPGYRATAQTTWKQGIAATGSVILSTEFTDWTEYTPIGDWSGISLEGQYVDTDPARLALFNDVAVKGDFAYVSSDQTAAGPDLFVFSLADPSAPQLVRSLTVDGSVHDVGLRGDMLYVVAEDADAELQAYTLDVPDNPSLVTTADLPGSGDAQSLSVAGNVLLAGTSDALLSFDISDPSSITARGSLFTGGRVNRIRPLGRYAYLATSAPGDEFQVANFTNTGALAWASPSAYGLSQAATAVAVTGTSALVGTLSGAAIQEFSVFDVKEGGAPVPPPDPWTSDIMAKVAGLDADPTACYAFIASDYSPRELQVLRLMPSLMEAAAYDTPVAVGGARGVRYDVPHDRLYLLTDDAFLLFKPASSPSPCPP